MSYEAGRKCLSLSLMVLLATVCGCDGLYRLDGMVVQDNAPGFTVVADLASLDPLGRGLSPVQGASVRVFVRRLGRIQEYRGKRESDVTDDQGRFDTAIWWGGFDCCCMSWDSAVVEKPGYQTVRIPADQLRRPGVKDHMFIKLVRSK